MNARSLLSLCVAALAAQGCFSAPIGASSTTTGATSSGATSSGATSSGSTSAGPSGSTSGTHGSASGSTGSHATASSGSTGTTAHASSGSTGVAVTGTSGSSGTGTTGTSATVGSTGTTATTANPTIGSSGTSAGPTSGSTGTVATGSTGTTGVVTTGSSGTTGVVTTGSTGTVATATSSSGTTGIGSTGTVTSGSTGTVSTGTSGSSGSTGTVIAGDTCAAASAPSALTVGVPVTGDTTNFANDYDAPANNPCFPNANQDEGAGPDVVYTFTAPSAGTYTVQVLPNGQWDPILYIAPISVCTAQGLAACTGGVDDNGAGQTETLSLNAQSGVVYGIFVDGFQATDFGAYTLLISPPPQPACNAPIALSVGVGTASAVTGDTSSQANNSQSSCGGSQSPDVVYSITPTQDMSLTATITGTRGQGGQPGFTPVIYLQTACADTTTEQSCVAAQRGGGGGGGAPTGTLTTDLLLAGQTYFLWVDGFQGASGAYTLSVSGAAPVTPLLGEQCSALTVNGTTNEIQILATPGGGYVGSVAVDLTGYADNSLSAGDGTCGINGNGSGRGPDEVWKVVLPPGTTSLTATMSPGNGAQYGGLVYIREGNACVDRAQVSTAPGGELACGQGYNNFSATADNLIAGGTYYVWLDSYSSNFTGAVRGTLSVSAQ